MSRCERSAAIIRSICDEGGGFTAMDEGDYGERSATIGGRIVHTVPGKLDDSYCFHWGGRDSLPFLSPRRLELTGIEPGRSMPLDRQAPHGTQVRFLVPAYARPAGIKPRHPRHGTVPCRIAETWLFARRLFLLVGPRTQIFQAMFK